jgi:hypothetical protein
MIFLLTCSSPAPNASLETATFNEVAHANIGSDGGALTYKSFSLLIPPGAFSGTAELILQYSATEKPFATQSVTGTYRITGLPETMYDSLSIFIKTDTSQTPIIAIGESRPVPSAADSLCSFSFLSTSFSADTAQAKFISNAQPLMLKRKVTTSSAMTYEIDISVVSGYATHESDNFCVRFPTHLAATDIPEQITSMMETIRDTIRVMGFDLSSQKKLLEIILKPLTVDGYFVPEGLFNSSCIELNSKSLTTSSISAMNISAAHEYFHFVQSLHYKLSNIDTWFDEASAVWFEAKFSADPSHYVSDVWNGRQNQPLYGFQAGVDSADAGSDWWVPYKRIATKAQNHGYGMAAVLAYLTKSFGEWDGSTNRMKSIFDELTIGYRPLKAIDLEFPFFYTSLDSFFNSYITGDAYGKMTPPLSSSYTIGSTSEVNHSFNFTMNDLSCKVFQITLPSIKILSTGKLNIILSGVESSRASVTVINANKIGQPILGTAAANKNLAIDTTGLPDKTKLWIVITNNQTGSTFSDVSPMTLQIGVPAPPSGITATKYVCSKFYGQHMIRDKFGLVEPDSKFSAGFASFTICPKYIDNISDTVKTIWSGNSFSLTGTETTSGALTSTYTYSLQGTLSADQKSIKTMTVNFINTDVLLATNIETKQSFSHNFNDIPLLYEGNSTMAWEFKISGSEVQKHISSIAFNYDDHYFYESTLWEKDPYISVSFQPQ